MEGMLLSRKSRNGTTDSTGSWGVLEVTLTHKSECSLQKAEDTNIYSILVLVSDNQGIFHQLISGKQEDIKSWIVTSCQLI